MRNETENKAGKSAKLDALSILYGVGIGISIGFVMGVMSVIVAGSAL